MADEIEQVIDYNGIAKWTQEEYNRISDPNEIIFGSNLIHTAENFHSLYTQYNNLVQAQRKTLTEQWKQKGQSLKGIIAQARKEVYELAENQKLIEDIGKAQIAFQQAIFDAQGMILVTIEVNVDGQNVVANQLKEDLEARRTSTKKGARLNYAVGKTTTGNSQKIELNEEEAIFANSLLKQAESVSGRKGYVAEAIYSAAVQKFRGTLKAPFIDTVVRNLYNADTESGLYTADYIEQYQDTKIQIAYQIKTKGASYIGLSQTYKAAEQIMVMDPKTAYDTVREMDQGSGQFIGVKKLIKGKGRQAISNEGIKQLVEESLKAAGLDDKLNDILKTLK